MINIKYAILRLNELIQINKKNERLDKSSIEQLAELNDYLSNYHVSRNNQNKRIGSLVQADKLVNILLFKLKNQGNGNFLKVFSQFGQSKTEFDNLLLILSEIAEYCENNIQKHAKIKRILQTISVKEIMLQHLRAIKDYRQPEDQGLGHEPYLPSQNNPIKLKKQEVKKGENGQILQGLDDRRVIDGRGLAPTLRHQIEKYDPLHRPWRNFLYREYNNTFDFWKNIKDVAMHLIYPEKNGPEEYNAILQKWINKNHTYTKDLLIIYNNVAGTWNACIRDEKCDQKYTTMVLDEKSPLRAKLKKINEKNCRDYDRRILEDIIINTQPFSTLNKNHGYYFYRNNNNFYSWVSQNTKLKTPNVVAYFNELERIKYLVRPNEKGQLTYLQSGEIINTKEDTGFKPEHFIYTLDMDGNLYIAQQGPFNGDPNMRIQHPSFVSGERLLAAGTIKVQDGKVTSIDNGSGHYMPGEFSLMKIVLELKKNNLLAEDCKINFITMNSCDDRYASENGNLNTVDQFLKICQTSFLATVCDTNNSKGFDTVWNQTDISKISLNKMDSAQANVDFLFDQINHLINELSKAINKKHAMAASKFQAIRTKWLSILNDIVMGASNDGVISAKHVVSILESYLSQMEKEYEAFAEILSNIKTILTSTSKVNCVFSKDRVMNDCMAYNLQVRFALAKTQHEDDMQPLAAYKLFLLTSKIGNSNLMSAADLNDIENMQIKLSMAVKA